MSDLLTFVSVLDSSFVARKIACLPITNGAGSGFIQATQINPWNATVITTATTTIVKGAPGILGAVINLDPAQPQAGNIQGFDNASIGTGPSYFNVTNLETELSWPPGGIQHTLGIVVVTTGVPTGGGFVILWI